MATTKQSPCPTCCPDFPVTFEMDWDQDGNNIWSCMNCGHAKPRREFYKRREGITPAQQKTIEQLKAALLKRNDLGEPGRSEIKSLDVKDQGSFVSMVIEVGVKGDEGSALSLFRDYRHIFIGRKGGVQLLNAKLKGKSRGFWNVIHALTR